MRDRIPMWYAATRRALVSLALLASTTTMSNTPAATMNVTPVAAVRLSCRASVPPTLRGTQPAVLTLLLHNEGRLPLYVLRRNTPLEGWLADSLTVTRDGELVPYTGAMAKRMPPQAAEYLVLKPGQRYRYRTRLAPAYEVGLAGRYQLQWRGELMDVRVAERPQPGHELHALTVACPTVEFVRTR